MRVKRTENNLMFCKITDEVNCSKLKYLTCILSWTLQCTLSWNREIWSSNTQGEYQKQIAFGEGNELSLSWREEEGFDFKNPLHVLSHTTNSCLEESMIRWFINGKKHIEKLGNTN